MTEAAKKKEYNSEDFQESHFGIRNKQDLVHIFNVLRNKMYTNKPLAVLREYATNAMDSHIESGQKDRPIKVVLPTSMNRTLSIRDYGGGLSEEDIRGVYTMYGASTKRGSTELNGQLGFGSKAAFSYTDQYTIVSYNEGRERVYEAYVDETGLGAISLLTDKESSEPSGIEIRIQVQLSDIPAFQQTAAQLYKYFTVTPEVHNLHPYKIERPKYSYNGTNWGLRSDTTVAYGTPNITAIMGNVGYPLSYQVLQTSLRNYGNWAKIEPMLRCSVDLRFKVGDLSIAASREALEYDKKTLKSVSDALENAVDEITKEFQTRLEKATDLVEARNLYKSLIHGELAPLAQALNGSGKSLRWKNQTINTWMFSLPDISHTVTAEDGTEVPAKSYEVLQIAAARNSYTGIKQYWTSAEQQVEVNDENKFFLRDTKDKPMLRVRQYFADNPKMKNVYLFEPSEHCTLEDFCEEMEVPSKYFVNLSSIEPMEVEHTKKAGPVNAKHQQKVFRLASNQSGYSDSSHWESATIDSEQEYYYVYLDRFVPTWSTGGSNYNNSLSNHSLRALVESYKTLTGEDITSKIIGIKISAASRVKDHWKPINEVITKGIEGRGDALKIIATNEGVRAGSQSNTVLNMIQSQPNLVRTMLTAESPLRKHVEQVVAANAPANATVQNTYQAYTTIRSYLRLGHDQALESLKSAETNKALQAVRSILNRYPMLQHVSMPWNYNYNNPSNLDHVRMVLAYCNLVDRYTT